MKKKSVKRIATSPNTGVAYGEVAMEVTCTACHYRCGMALRKSMYGDSATKRPDGRVSSWMWATRMCPTRGEQRLSGRDQLGRFVKVNEVKVNRMNEVKVSS